MANLNGLVQRLSNCQSTEQSTRKGVSSTVRIDNLFILGGVDSVHVDIVRTAGVDSDGWLSTTDKQDNTIAGGLDFCC